MTKEKNHRNELLNVLKGIACMGVVFIHVRFPGVTGEIVSKIALFAVPVFFMTAGYYSFGAAISEVRRKLLKMIKIFAYAYACFFAYHIAVQILKGGGKNVLEWLAANYCLKSMAKYVIFCTIDFAIPLWYLIAMIETYFFWYFIVKTGREELLLKLLPVLFMAQILLTCVCDTIGAAWFWKVNFVTRALPWFLFGYYAHSAGVERQENCGDRLSLNIYVFHVLINGAINVFAGHVMKWNTESKVYLWTEPLLTLVAAIVWAFILDRMKILAGRA